MILSSIYLLLINNAKTLTSGKYITEFTKTFTQLYVIYTIPYIIFGTITQLSDNKYTNMLCYNIYWYLYHIPSFAIIYTIHTSKLAKLLEVNYITYTNPHHNYITVLYSFIYILSLYISSIFNTFIWVRYICDTFSLSIFFNEIGYHFLDNATYKYSNSIDFYNSNWYIFAIYGCIVSHLIYYIPVYLFIPTSYAIISIFQNTFINLPYNKPNNNYNNYNNYNILYLFEYIFNILITCISTLMFCSFNRRVMIIEPT